MAWLPTTATPTPLLTSVSSSCREVRAGVRRMGSPLGACAGMIPSSRYPGAPCGHRLGDAVLNAPVAGFQIVPQRLPDGSDRHLPTGAMKQRHPEPALQLFDRLADPGTADAEPFGRAREMQLLGQRQKDLDIAPFHLVHASGRCRCVVASMPWLRSRRW
jgi:hypothetical protein